MKYERWLIPETDDAAVEALMDAGYPYLVSTVLASRGVVTPEQAAAHLDRERSLVYSPFLMRDMDKAVARIDRALAGGETIAVFGDYDVDGITSTCLLTDYLRSRGAAVLMHIPRRIEEGYGLGCDAIRALAEQGVTLIVTVDCGITGVEETAFAATLGVDLVITDHHECKDELPAACAVVDPHRPDCGFPFKHLAGVGVALELVLALGGAERENALFSRYCTLAAIGTIADVMRMEGENRTIVQCGLEGIDRSDFTGLHALLREAGLTGRPVSSVQIGFVLAPRINAAGRMGRAELAAELLLTQDPAKAERLARELCDLNRERQSVEQDIFRCAIEQMDTLAPTERNALVLSSEEWHQGVVGIVASRLSEKFSCPSFMIHLAGGMGKGSCARGVQRPARRLWRARARRGLHHQGGEYPRLPQAHQSIRPHPLRRLGPRLLAGDRRRPHPPEPHHASGGRGAFPSRALRRGQQPPCFLPARRAAGVHAERRTE